MLHQIEVQPAGAPDVVLTRFDAQEREKPQLPGSPAVIERTGARDNAEGAFRV